MSLSNKKLKFIRRNQENMPAARIAAHLKLDEKEVKKAILGFSEQPAPFGLISRLDMAFFACVAIFGFSAPFILKQDLHDFANLPQTAFILSGVLFLTVFMCVKIAFDKAGFYFPRAFSWPLICFSAWAGASLFWAKNPFEGVSIWFHWTICVLFFFVVANALKHKDRFGLLFAAFFFSGFVTAAIGIGQHLFGLSAIPQAVPPAATFANRNMAVHFIILTMPLGVAFFLNAKKGIVAWVFAFCVTLMTAYLFYTFNRAGWACLLGEIVFGLALLLVLRKKSGLTLGITTEKKAVAGVCVVLFLVLFNLTPHGFEWQFGKIYDRIGIAVVEGIDRFKGPEDNPIIDAKPDQANSLEKKAGKSQDQAVADTSLQLRFDIWRNSLEMIKDRPVFGVGVGNHKVHYPIYARRAVVEKVFSESSQLTNVHNDYIQSAAELGLVGIVLLLWLGVTLVRVLLRLFSSLERDHLLLAVAVATGLAGIAVNAFASFPLQRAIPPMVVAAFLAALAVFDDSAQKKNRIFHIPKALAGVGALAIAMCFVYGTWMEHCLIECDRHYRNISAAEKLCQWDRVLLESNRALKSNPYKTKIYSYMGRAYIEKGENKNAIDALLRVVDKYPYHMNALLNLGVAYGSLGQYEKALEIYDRVIRIKPDYHKVHNNIGNIYMHLKKPGKAMEFFEVAARHDPKNEIVWFNMGIAAVQINDFQKSKHAFLKALKRKPDWAKAHQNLGMILFNKLGEKEKGVWHLKKAMELKKLEKQKGKNQAFRRSAYGRPVISGNIR